MDFTLPEELRMLRENLRRYVDREMIPVERETTTEDEELKPEWLAKYEKGMKDLGLYMFDIPEAYGGQGLGIMARCIIWEELARTVALPARHASITGPSVRAILFELNDALKERFLYRGLGDHRARLGL